MPFPFSSNVSSGLAPVLIHWQGYWSGAHVTTKWVVFTVDNLYLNFMCVADAFATMLSARCRQIQHCAVNIRYEFGPSSEGLNAVLPTICNPGINGVMTRLNRC